MITGHNCDLGSWKGGKVKDFTHIPTNFNVLFKNKFFYEPQEETKENKFLLIIFDVKGFESFQKTFDIRNFIWRERNE